MILQNPVLSLMAGLLVFATAPSKAQESATEELAKLPPPKFPILLRAPAKATWTIALAKDGSPSGEQPQAGALSQLVVSKSGPLYHEKATVSKGPGWEQWSVLRNDGRPFKIIKYDDTPKWSQTPRSGHSIDGSNFEKSDFEEFQWIDQKNYKAAQALPGGTLVYYFEMYAEGPLTQKEAMTFDIASYREAKASGKAYNGRTVRAWIDAKTLLPVKFDSGSQVFTYTFGSAGSPQLTPPPEVIGELKQWLEEIKIRRH